MSYFCTIIGCNIQGPHVHKTLGGTVKPIESATRANPDEGNATSDAGTANGASNKPCPLCGGKDCPTPYCDTPIPAKQGEGLDDERILAAVKLVIETGCTYRLGLIDDSAVEIKPYKPIGNLPNGGSDD